MTAHLGWPHTVGPRPWDELARTFAEAARRSPSLAPVAEIVQSVVVSGRADRLAATTSMTDLLVCDADRREPPTDVLRVRAVDNGVEIEHLAPTGRNDRLRRPAGEAVALFWRFVELKLGIEPTR